MATIGIIAALDIELAAFIKDFDASPAYDGSLYRGSFAGHDVILALCGVGKVNAAICTQKLIDLAKPDAVINSGVAGGLSDKLSVCDLAIADRLVYHDFYPLSLLEKYAPHCAYFQADRRLKALAENAASALSRNEPDFHYEVGCIVSGDRFVEESAIKERLKAEFGAVCTEMEGAAIAHTAYVNGVPFAVIRAISDNADEKADMSFEAMAAIAAKRAVIIVKNMIGAYKPL